MSRVVVTETNVEPPSKPVRLTVWQGVRRALFVWRHVLAAMPAIIRQTWRDTWADWRISRALLALARQIRVERDVVVPNGTTPQAPVGPRLSCRPAGDSSPAVLSVDDYARDAGFMLTQAAIAVKHHEQSGRGALVVNFRGDPLRPHSGVYFPLEAIERMGCGAVILNPVRRYDPMSEAVVILAGDYVKACLVGVERIGRPCAQG